jgi:hypothetical protein
MTRISSNNQMPSLTQPVETPATTEVQSTTPASLQPSQSGFEVGTGVQNATHNPKFSKAPAGNNTFSPLSLMIDTAKGGKLIPTENDNWSNMQSYFKSDYNYNDAEMVGQLWNMPTTEAKALIGQKLNNGQFKALDNLVTEATIAAKNAEMNAPGMGDWSGTQAFYKAGYTYNDAQDLANSWGMSVADAKNFAGEKLLRGDGSLLEDYWLNPKNMDIPARPAGMDDWTGTQAYFKSDYNYDDAALIAGFWNMPVTDAKSLIGDKLLAGQHKNLDNLLTEATIAAKNGSVRTPGADDTSLDGAYTFLKSGYTYNDAQELATAWGMSVTEAKVFAGEKIMRGDGALLDTYWLNTKGAN